MLHSSRSARALLPAVLLAVLAAGCSSNGWQAVRLDTDATWNGIWFTDPLNGWISGRAHDVAGGVLGRTRDGGRTWTIRRGVVNGMHAGFALGQIQFRDSLRGCVVGDSGLVLLTDDGGARWRRVHSMGYGTITRVQLLGERAGWAFGPAATIGTSDGGETWHELVGNQSGPLYFSGRAAVFTSALHGWLLGPSCELMRTEDGGQDWTLVPLPADSRGGFLDVTFVDVMNGWLVGESGAISHTRDGGVTWERQTSGVPVERVLKRGEKPHPFPEARGPSKLMLVAVRFADAERGFTVGSYADAGESVILGTRDGGATWTTEKIVPGQFLQSLFVLDRRHAWAAGTRVRPGAPTLYRYTAAD